MPRTTRQYYRIQYPLSYRPKLRIEGEDSVNDIAELSERGVRIIYKGSRKLTVGSAMNVHITFNDDESLQLEGELLRVEKEDIIFRFTGSIPLNRILNEQRYLRTHIIGYM